jgi:hypothetical protein
MHTLIDLLCDVAKFVPFLLQLIWLLLLLLPPVHRPLQVLVWELPMEQGRT